MPLQHQEHETRHDLHPQLRVTRIITTTREALNRQVARFEPYLIVRPLSAAFNSFLWSQPGIFGNCFRSPPA